jgi:S-adenosylmethionine:tRNA ribosyltransferase-isomerase
VRFQGGLEAALAPIPGAPARLVGLQFAETGARLMAALYRDGRPVQYAYVPEPLELWDVQNAYAARPIAVELPSAGRALTATLLERLRSRGIGVASLTHAAGLSSTGDPSLDACLPLPEWSEVPEGVVDAVAEARQRGGRVVAVGTSVVRALEEAGRGGVLAPRSGETDLRIGAEHRLAVVDAILTGLHEAGTSHHRLLLAFAPAPVLDAALTAAERLGYLHHELGDLMLLLP